MKWIKNLKTPTYIEMFDPIGRTYRYEIEQHPYMLPFMVEVKVIDTRKRLFHPLEFLITPVNGRGSMWVPVNEMGVCLDRG